MLGAGQTVKRQRMFRIKVQGEGGAGGGAGVGGDLRVLKSHPAGGLIVSLYRGMDAPTPPPHPVLPRYLDSNTRWSRAERGQIASKQRTNLRYTPPPRPEDFQCSPSSRVN